MLKFRFIEVFDLVRVRIIEGKRKKKSEVKSIEEINFIIKIDYFFFLRLYSTKLDSFDSLEYVIAFFSSIFEELMQFCQK